MAKQLLNRRKKIVDDLREEREKDIKSSRNKKIIKNDLVPTGSTLLNLALSDHIEGGYYLRKIVNVLGDSSAGKTLLVLTGLAEVANNSRFKEYRLIYDEPEVSNEWDLPAMFGNKMANRVELNIVSKTVNQFRGNFARVVKDGKPFIYVIDSWDAVEPDGEDEDDSAYIKFAEDGTKIKGSYGTQKAKAASDAWRKISKSLEKMNSLLIIVSQTRDKIGVTFGSTKTASRGKAMKFYLCHEIWLAVKKSEKVKERIIGEHIICKVNKNKLTGKRRTVEYPTYNSLGVDDIQSCINFLIEENHWKKVKSKIDTKGFVDEPVSEKALIDFIESENLEKELSSIVGDVWLSIENALKLDRKRRYK